VVLEASQMATDPMARRTRRAVLASAVGGAAALAATQLAQPITAAAADPNDVVLNQDNPAVALTSVTQATTNTGAFRATAAGSGTGVEGVSPGGAGVLGSTPETLVAGVAGIAGPLDASTYAAAEPLNTGVYGYANLTDTSSGVWGESYDGWGVYGSGLFGVGGSGAVGGDFEGSYVGLVGLGLDGGAGAHVHAGGGTVPTPTANTALLCSVGSTSQVGLEARGRIRFPNRSGKARIAAGKSSVAVTVSGVTSSNFAIATLATNRSSRYVRAVVCSTGKITIYLNSTVSATTYVSWLVLG
jgi:hypothetical protein